MADRFIHKHRITEKGHIELNDKILDGHEILYKLDRCDELEEQLNQANDIQASEATAILPLVSKPCHTTEIVQKYSDGTEEVKYRRPYGSNEALEMMQDVDKRCRKDGYFYRHVC